MNNIEILQAIFGGLFVIFLYALFLGMFFRAMFYNELIFHGGIIHGRLARILGVIGMIGITAGGYLAIRYLVFHTEPPFMKVAAFLFCLFFFMVISIRFLSIFFWHPK